MKIIYNPYYDGDIYLGDAPKCIGSIYVGNMGLLDQLEMRVGLSSTTLSEAERESGFHQILKKYIKGTKFEKSFNTDEYGASAIMLNWRDQLIMAGWNGTCHDCKEEKLNLLASVETEFRLKGVPDRWKDLYDKCRTVSTIGQIEEVVINIQWSEVPHIIQQIIGILEQKGIKISKMPDCENPDIAIEKYKVLEFSDVNDAYEWIASIRQFPEDTVVINKDNTRLNHTLYSWNKPRVHSSYYNSNPQLLQLFKLGISMFSRPLDVQRIVSYLRLPISPIPAKLRYALSNQLLSGGFGETKKRNDGKERDEWDEIINRFISDEVADYTTKQKQQKLCFIKPIRTDYDNGIPKSDIIEFIKSLKKWIQGKLTGKQTKDTVDLPEEIKVQLSELMVQLSSFETVIQALSDNIKYEDFADAVHQIYRPINYSLQSFENGSFSVIPDVISMVNHAKTVIWLDCYSDDSEVDLYEFISESERAYLSKQGVVIPDFAKHLSAIRSHRLNLLFPVENVFLVRSFYDGAIRLGEHPMIAELKCACNNNVLPVVDSLSVFDLIQKDLERGNIRLFKPQYSYELGEVKYKGRKESNTSIDTLINYPFDYFVKYVARLNEEDSQQMQSTYITLGLVAHQYFHQLMNDGSKGLSIMKRLNSDGFDERLMRSICATGLVLNMPENAVELNIYKINLQKSCEVLISICDQLKLIPIDCELSIPDESDSEFSLAELGAFGARIDLLLQDKNNNYVVFDLKWSYSGKFEEKLKSDTALQLELYGQTVKKKYEINGPVKVGYFLMPKKQLVTTDFDDVVDGNIKHVDKNRSLVPLSKKIENSFAFRMDEIKSGHLEEAEMMDLLPYDTNYYNNQENLNLVPLLTDDDTSGRGKNKQLLAAKKRSQDVFKIKKTNKSNYSDKKPKIDASEKATTFQILKGRLK